MSSNNKRTSTTTSNVAKPRTNQAASTVPSGSSTGVSKRPSTTTGAIRKTSSNVGDYYSFCNVLERNLGYVPNTATGAIRKVTTTVAVKKVTSTVPSGPSTTEVIKKVPVQSQAASVVPSGFSSGVPLKPKTTTGAIKKTSAVKKVPVKTKAASTVPSKPSTGAAVKKVPVTSGASSSTGAIKKVGSTKTSTTTKKTRGKQLEFISEAVRSLLQIENEKMLKNNAGTMATIPEAEPQKPQKIELKFLICPICLTDPPNEPTTTPCGHIYCNRCILGALKLSHKCPMCSKVVNCTQLIRVYFN